MRKGLRFTIAAAVSLIALEAAAGGFAVREQSASLQGFSFAGAATSGGGISGMFWNPAVITQSPGINTESHFSLILGNAKITPTTGSGALVANSGGSGNIAMPAVVPASYGSYQINDKLYLGLSINAPYGLTTKSNVNWSGQIYGRSSRATNIVATPTLGVKLTDWLAIGVGVQISYLDVSLKSATTYTPNAPSATLAGDGWAIGYTLGATITPVAGTEIGIGFRSSVRHALDGSFTHPLFTRGIKANLNLPEVVTVGLKQRVTQDLNILAGFEWSNWSRVRNAAITYSAPIPAGTPTSLPFFYKDSWMVSLGAEYRVNPNLLLRTGVGYEKSPTSDGVRNVRIPDNDRIWASVGMSYQWNNQLSFDASYTHIFVKDPKVRIAAGHPDFKNPFVNLVGSGKAHVDIISVGLKYRWDNPPTRNAITKG